ncbi:MAG: hypothetical protein WBY94_18500 [Polyangiaceae bacterium]
MTVRPIIADDPARGVETKGDEDAGEDLTLPESRSTAVDGLKGEDVLAVEQAGDALLARSLDDGTKKGSRPRGGQSFIYSRTLYRHYPTREALFESAYRNEIKGLCDEAPRLFKKHRPD